MVVSTRVISLNNDENNYTIKTDGVDIKIWFLTDTIIRIRTGFEKDFSEGSYSLMMTAWEDRMDSVFGERRKKVVAKIPQLQENEKAYILSGEKLKVIIEKDPFRICVYDKAGVCVHADIPDLCYMEDSNHRRIHTSEIFPGDCFYGFGEKAGTINKLGKTMTMSPGDAMGYDPEKTDSLYKHIPFYIKLNQNTKKSVGYFYHNTSECDFNMGQEKRNYWKPYSRYRADKGNVDVFLIYGPEIPEVIKQYTDLTGKSAMLPKAALGYLGSSMYYPELPKDCDDAIVEFIDTTKEEDIPVDGFQLSSGYTTQENNKRCVFTWNKDRFKDPKKFFKEMKKRGITVSPNVKPGLLLVHPLLEELKAQDIFVKNEEGTEPGIGTWWGGKGIFVDFTSEKARTVWKTYLKKNVLDMGTDSIWNDNCEYDSIVNKDCKVSFEGKGSTIGEVKAAMSNLMCMTTAEAIHETFKNVRPYIVCRSGHAGIQQYAQTWAGDNLTCWESLKYNIATMLGMSLSGVANQGCDIGGFYGRAPEAELFVRWIQNGIFQPRFSIHSVNIDNTVTEPWMYAGYTQYIREAIKFRYRMIPYLYSLMERAHESGLPIIQPMFAVFQQDTNCYEEGVDFMLGESLVVANVVEKGQTSRKVYLPKGEVFYDFYTREVYQGGQTVEIPVDISSIPLFVRNGAIIPMSRNQMMNLKKDKVEGLYMILAPGKDSEFTLYDDDGVSLNYENGDYKKTKISVTAGEKVIVDMKSEGNYKDTYSDVYLDVIHPEKAPFWVTVENNKLPHFLHRAKFEAAKEGWYYSQTLQSVQIKYKNPNTDYKIVISFEQFDMIGM